MEEIISDTGTDSEQVGPTFGNAGTDSEQVGPTFGNAACGCDLSKEIEKDNQPTEKMNEGEAAHDNPYAYVDRADFTSEKFKIEIRGLPKFYGIGVRFPSLLNVKNNVFTRLWCDPNVMCLPGYGVTQM